MTPTSDPLIRPSAIAGAWYPGSRAELRGTVEALLASVVTEPAPGRVLALISPHAGYAFSGATAAHAFAQVRGMAIRRVVLLGPLHRMILGSRLGAYMAPLENAYRTPLGDVAVDREYLDRLGERTALTEVRGDQEHSLEIELPFLQIALGASFALVPIMIGEHITDSGALARADRMASAIAALDDGQTLIVASSDLSHLDNYARVREVDGRLLSMVEEFDVQELATSLHSEEVLACGATGVVVALRAAQMLGARSAHVLAYESSGDVTGDKRPGTYTVGYMAAAVYA